VKERMTFQEIMADKKTKHQAYICWSLSMLALLLPVFADIPWHSAVIFSAWLIFAPFMKSMNVQYPDHFEDPLSQLRLEGKMLHVKQHQVEVAYVNKVAIDKINQHTAFIDFPYNMFGKLKFSFPTQQLPAVKAFFQQHCPHIQIIS
jgi:hypothetical protein